MSAEGVDPPPGEPAEGWWQSQLTSGRCSGALGIVSHSTSPNPFRSVAASGSGVTAPNPFARKRKRRLSTDGDGKPLPPPPPPASLVNVSVAELVSCLSPIRSSNTAECGFVERRRELVHPCGVCSCQGPRAHMEDRYSIVGGLGGEGASFYGVFDGHGGATAAEFCAAHLHANLAERGAPSALRREDVRGAFLATDEQFRATPRQSAGRDVLAGSTAVALVLEPSGRCVVANLGDSRAVLVRRATEEEEGEGSSSATSSAAGSVVEQLTVDHKPHTESEQARIEAAGGEVREQRVNGILSMSRAIGDRMLKRFVIAEPDVSERMLRPKPGADHFLILGTDGLWDFISNEHAAAIVSSSGTLQLAAERLVAAATRAHSNDNITALVVGLGWQPAAAPAAEDAAEEKKVDAREEEVAEASSSAAAANSPPPPAVAAPAKDGSQEQKRKRPKLSILLG